MFIGLGSDAFADSLPLSPHRYEQDVEYLSPGKKLVPILIIGVVATLTWLSYSKSVFQRLNFLILYVQNIKLIKFILIFVVKEQCGFNMIYYICFNFLMKIVHSVLFKE